MITEREINQFFNDLSNLGLKFPVAEISRKTGYVKGNVSDFINKKKPIPENFLKAFYKAFKSYLNVPHETVQEPEGSYLSKRRDLKNNGAKPDVPVFGGFTTLGNIDVYDDEGMRNQVIAKLPAEVFPGCDYAEKAKGDSMYPLIMNQALLVGKTCTVKGITYGEKYIIKTREGMDTTKFIHPGTKKNCILLKAYNKSVPDQEISCEEIVFACRVHWIVNPT